LKVYTLYYSKQAEKEEQATKEVVAAPLKADTDFAPQPAEAWGNEIVTEPVPRSWAEDVPVVAPVSGSTTQPVTYSTSDDWATQVSVLFSEVTSTSYNVYRSELVYYNLELRHILITLLSTG
jgi:hypothetical protein